MPFDKTPLFRARVKAIKMQEATRLRRADMQQGQQREQTSNTCNFREEQRKRSSENGPSFTFLSFTMEAKQIHRELIAIRDMVIAAKKNYVSDIGHFRRLISPYKNSMTDFERDELDARIESMLRDNIQSIQTLQRKIIINTDLRADDEAPHLFEVLRLLGRNLNRTAKVVAEMRALRTKKTTNFRQTCRLATLAKLYSIKKRREESIAEKKMDEDSAETASLKSDSIADLQTHSEIFGKQGLRKRLGISSKFKQNEWSVPSKPNLEEDENVDPLTDLDGDERIQLMIENELLYSRSLQVDNDIQKVEKQMIDLYRLQETFAEKVAEQEKGISLVNETTIVTVENLRLGNEQIRQAIQNMASRRVILLFCIIVLTFTLLFLDWYNP
ncbi:unnamed protein product [Thelazia callipaeda]|uniref:Syntaxin-18_N domain-containing protein n=1 Tax=Thelazia callipaeda TaxID=103827 RepID=A0A0N5DC29_THECL|nr:unnamed protein product [Thelazia callipaeda]